MSFPDYSNPLVVFGSRNYHRTGSARENGEQLVSDLEEAGIQFDAIVSGGARGADRAGEVAGVLTDTPVVVFNVNGVDDRHHWYADHSDAHYQVETVSAVGVADARVEVEEAHEAEDADNDDGGDDDVHDVEEDDNDDTVVGVESDERGDAGDNDNEGDDRADDGEDAEAANRVGVDGDGNGGGDAGTISVGVGGVGRDTGRDGGARRDGNVGGSGDGGATTATADSATTAGDGAD